MTARASSLLPSVLFSWLAAALSIGASGCAPLQVKWVPPSEIARPDPARYPKADAVELLRHDDLDINLPRGGGRPTYRITRHRRVAVLTEAGLSQAEVRLVVGSKVSSELLVLRARSIAPDGEVREVTPAEIREEESKVSAEPTAAQATPDEWRRVVAKVFRFPNARVGSILEFVSVVEYRGLHLDHMQAMSGTLPVERYEAVVKVGGAMEVALDLHNAGDARWVRGVDSEGGGDRSTLVATHLRGDPHEFAEPHLLLRTPWWELRTLRLDFGFGNKNEVFSNWAEALKGVTRALLGNNIWLFMSEWPDLDKARCENVPCLARQGLDVLRDKAELSGFSDDLFDIRSVREMAGSGTVTSSEKAALLYRMLKNAGVQSTFAVTTRDVGIYDPDVPSANTLDHLLLYLPEQPGLTEPLWVDPSCEHCAPGEVPEWVARRSALLISTKDEGNHTRLGIEEVTVGGAHTGAGGVHTDYQAQLEDSGDLTLDITEERRGAEAVSTRIRTRSATPEMLERDAQQFLKYRFPVSQVISQTALTCDRAAGRCRRTFRVKVPGYATRDHDRLLVPLTLLYGPWDERFLDESRVEELWFPEAEEDSETVTVKLPPGWSVAERPGRVAARTPLLETAFTVAPVPMGFTVGRTVKVNPGHQPAAIYSGLRHAVRSLSAVRQQVVTLQKGAAASKGD